MTEGMTIGQLLKLKEKELERGWTVTSDEPDPEEEDREDWLREELAHEFYERERLEDLYGDMA